MEYEAPNLATSGENPDLKELSSKLFKHKFLFNPTRFLILSYLDCYSIFTTSEMRKLLDLSWGSFNDHLNALLKKDLIETREEFIENGSNSSRPKRVISISPNGRALLREFKKLFDEILYLSAIV